MFVLSPLSYVPMPRTQPQRDTPRCAALVAQNDSYLTSELVRFVNVTASTDPEADLPLWVGNRVVSEYVTNVDVLAQVLSRHWAGRGTCPQAYLGSSTSSPVALQANSVLEILGVYEEGVDVIHAALVLNLHIDAYRVA